MREADEGERLKRVGMANRNGAARAVLMPVSLRPVSRRDSRKLVLPGGLLCGPRQGTAWWLSQGGNKKADLASSIPEELNHASMLLRKYGGHGTNPKRECGGTWQLSGRNNGMGE